MADANPFFTEWRTPHAIPPFEAIRVEHFKPAFDAAIAAQRDSIAQIRAAHADRAPTFASLMVPLERSGAQLRRVEAVFHNLASAHTNPELQAVERDLAPLLARHANAVAMDVGLFKLVEKLDADMKAARGNAAPRNPEERLVDRSFRGFVRRGAQLKEGSKERARFAEATERLAALAADFAQKVLADEGGWELRLSSPEELVGLSPPLLSAARAAATERGLDTDPAGRPIHVITLSRSSVEPFLAASDNRALRKKACDAWALRGANGNANDTRETVREMLRLRAEVAHILGFASFAEFALEDRMARTTGAVDSLLMQCWRPALDKAKDEERELLDVARRLGHNDVQRIEPHDYRYYVGKLRALRFDLDESAVKRYYSLDRLVQGMFYAAGRLYGLKISETTGKYPRYHPQLRTFEVTDATTGSLIGVLMCDFFSRQSKRGGAWMSEYRGQSMLEGADERPIVVNVLNFNAPAKEGEPVLLSADDSRTLFHEFGHALHGLLSRVVYPSQSGTNVLSDFVELPSQINERFLEPLARLPAEVNPFRDVETGAVIPAELLARMEEGRTFGEGFATVEFLLSALVDMDVHSIPYSAYAKGAAPDPFAVEQATIARLGAPASIPPRHRLSHFLHLFADGSPGAMYASGYFNYLWAEVLESDAFGAFEEAAARGGGSVLDPAVGAKFRREVLEVGGSVDPAEAFRRFRGRDPVVEPLLRKRGLLGKEARAHL
ncbi:Zn-dependent oligopeptidase [Hyaloraphidium curvatum]|nr:Zn-dependent oligopeptidase [Hyaloraphidium curvatum]